MPPRVGDGLLDHDTRHLIIKAILGHPDHLVSIKELAHFLGEGPASITEHVDVLVATDILDSYEGSNVDKPDRPTRFYGLTEVGVGVLERFGYLEGLPMERALYERTRKTERVQRHEAAPRPALPNAVADALALEGGADK